MPAEHPSGPVTTTPWPVMILAHNEERDIVRCLDSLHEAEPQASFRAFVVANGCRDRTAEPDATATSSSLAGRGW